MLDRYHLSKYVTQATAHMPDIMLFMWKYINNGDLKKLKELFAEIISSTETDTKKKSVREARSYILENWDGIRNQYEADYVGCSAQGHVSHIKLQAFGVVQNRYGSNGKIKGLRSQWWLVYDLLFAKKRNKLSKARRLKLDQEILKQRNQVATNETFGNIAILNRGKKTATAQFLRSIRTA